MIIQETLSYSINVVVLFWLNQLTEPWANPTFYICELTGAKSSLYRYIASDVKNREKLYDDLGKFEEPRPLW